LVDFDVCIFGYLMFVIKRLVEICSEISNEISIILTVMEMGMEMDNKYKGTQKRHKDNGDNVFRNYSISSITLNIF
tara:strand:- start:56 stop:283 length:228 start_codon:yes stop_codon:yes gene_type:complete